MLFSIPANSIFYKTEAEEKFIHFHCELYFLFNFLFNYLLWILLTVFNFTIQFNLYRIDTIFTFPLCLFTIPNTTRNLWKVFDTKERYKIALQWKESSSVQENSEIVTQPENDNQQRSSWRKKTHPPSVQSLNSSCVSSSSRLN